MVVYQKLPIISSLISLWSLDFFFLARFVRNSNAMSILLRPRYKAAFATCTPRLASGLQEWVSNITNSTLSVRSRFVSAIFMRMDLFLSPMMPRLPGLLPFFDPCSSVIKKDHHRKRRTVPASPVLSASPLSRYLRDPVHHLRHLVHRFTTISACLIKLALSLVPKDAKDAHGSYLIARLRRFQPV